jgi:hypothetical protein
LVRNAGEETYASLHQILEEMLRVGSLKKSVKVDLEDGTTEELDVHWHFCAHRKLVALEGGMGGSGCNLLGFLCPWRRDDPYAQHTERTLKEVETLQIWADMHLRGIHKAINEVRMRLSFRIKFPIDFLIIGTKCRYSCGGVLASSCRLQWQRRQTSAAHPVVDLLQAQSALGTCTGWHAGHAGCALVLLP